MANIAIEDIMLDRKSYYNGSEDGVRAIPKRESLVSIWVYVRIWARC